jgi:hypothetical protein
MTETSMDPELKFPQPKTEDLPLPSPPTPLRPAQWYYLMLIAGAVVFAVLYRLLVAKDVNHSALMFIGLPAVLAIVLALTPKAKTVTGGILKGMTLALLVLAPLLQEGMICILIVSPLYFGLGLIVGLILDRQRKRRGAVLSCIALVLLPLSLEGTTPSLTLAREESVTVTRVVAVPAAQVAEALAKSPRIDVPLPRILRIGFPLPLAATGSGAAVGDTRRIRFSAAEGVPAGDLVVRITRSEPGHLQSDVVENHTKLASWLRWSSSDVRWRPLDAGHTQVSWTMNFRRQLDPAWYFAPMQRAAVRQAAAYMIATNATPER